MCIKLKYCARQIDPCILDKVKELQKLGYATILSCCGHDKYNPSIVILNENNSVFDYYSNKKLKDYNPNFDKRHNTYYRRDDNGYYFIPDLI